MAARREERAARETDEDEDNGITCTFTFTMYNVQCI